MLAVNGRGHSTCLDQVLVWLVVPWHSGWGFSLAVAQFFPSVLPFSSSVSFSAPTQLVGQQEGIQPDTMTMSTARVATSTQFWDPGYCAGMVNLVLVEQDVLCVPRGSVLI